MKTSLDHLPERKQHELQLISHILRDTLDDYKIGKTASKLNFTIHKIILFGSHAKGGWVNDVANGYVSDYDILVIVNMPSLVDEDSIWRKAEEQIERKVKSAPLGLIVHTWKEVNQQLKQGHYFFKDIREQGIVLYEDSKKELAVAGELTEAERREIAQGHYDHWFTNADEFLFGYDVYLQRKSLAVAAFQLHQATERFYTCFLLTFTNYRPKTHNIEQLKQYAVDQHPDFADLFPMEDKFHRRSFQRLKRAYIDARYSMHYEISEAELTYLAGEVEKPKTLVARVCLARLQP